MNSMVWVLIFLPICLAFVVSQALKIRTVNYQHVQVGKHVFWVTLAICYVAVFAIAAGLHKL